MLQAKIFLKKDPLVFKNYIPNMAIIEKKPY